MLRFEREVIVVEVEYVVNYYYLYSLVSSISSKTGNAEIHFGKQSHLHQLFLIRRNPEYLKYLTCTNTQ